MKALLIFSSVILSTSNVSLGKSQSSFTCYEVSTVPEIKVGRTNYLYIAGTSQSEPKTIEGQNCKGIIQDKNFKNEFSATRNETIILCENDGNKIPILKIDGKFSCETSVITLN